MISGHEKMKYVSLIWYHILHPTEQKTIIIIRQDKVNKEFYLKMLHALCTYAHTAQGTERNHHHTNIAYLHSGAVGLLRAIVDQCPKIREYFIHTSLHFFIINPTIIKKCFGVWLDRYFFILPLCRLPSYHNHHHHGVMVSEFIFWVHMSFFLHFVHVVLTLAC